MASGGDSNPPSRGNFAVRKVRNYRMMDLRHAVSVRPPADPGEDSGSSRMLVYEDFETGLECSVDTELLDGTPRRFVQTNLGPFVYVDHVDELIAAPHVDVVFHPNDLQVQKLLENNCSRESIQEALDECLANFEWPSKMVYEDKMSSFKLVIEEGLSELLEAVLDMISDFSKHGQLFQLLREAFTEFGAQLQSIQLGSLTFHFHYTDQDTALRMIESKGAQGKLIGLLYQFLPDWVRVYARWEVQHYSSTEHRPSFTCKAETAMVWRIPLTPHSSHTGRPNKDAVDAEALTQIVEPMINRSTERILSTLGTVLTSLQDTIIDHIQRAVPPPQSVKDVSSSESQYPGSDSKDPAVLMEPEMSSSLLSPPLDTTKPGIGRPESEETVSTQETPDADTESGPLIQEDKDKEDSYTTIKQLEQALGKQRFTETIGAPVIGELDTESMPEVIEWQTSGKTKKISKRDISELLEELNLSEQIQGKRENEKNTSAEFVEEILQKKGSVEIPTTESRVEGTDPLDASASIVSKEPQEAEASPQDAMTTETQAYPESIWIPIINDSYPNLLSQTYFVPPINFSRVPQIVESIAGQTVSVRDNPPLRMPRDSHAKSSARPSPLPPPPLQVAGRVFVENPPDLPSVRLQESDHIDDASTEQCLRALSDIPGQVMMVISGLQFRKYLDDHTNPHYAATIAQLPTARHKSIPLRVADGECDIIIIHRQFGLVVGEMKSIRSRMFSDPLSEQNHMIIGRRIENAIQQLQMHERVLRHLVSDLPPIRISKAILLPNITSDHLRSALSSSAQLNMDLCECTNSATLSEAVSKCLCKEDVTQPITWWNSLVGQEPDPCMTDNLYQRLVGRFCGPATTIEVPTAGRSRKVVRSMGQAVAETGLRFSSLTLTPTQVALLNRADEPGFMYIQGPPGTGKSTVLLLKALQRTRQGAQVVIVGEDDTRAIPMLMKEQLLTMVEPEAASRIQTLYLNFSGDEFDAAGAVSKLRQQLGSGPALIILSEVHVSDQFIRWTKELRSKLPSVSVWACGRWRAMRPVPDWMEIKTLQEPLRRPPELVREMEKIMDIQSQAVIPYVHPLFPVATQGFPVQRLQHHGQPGHNDGHCLHCDTCADIIADIFVQLRVGHPGHSLRYRDMWILCGVDPHADDTMIQRLQQHHGLPVGVMTSDPPNEDDVRELALATHDRVMVTHYKHVRGLERRVVIGLGLGEDPLPAMSTSTSFYCCVD